MLLCDGVSEPQTHLSVITLTLTVPFTFSVDSPQLEIKMLEIILPRSYFSAMARKTKKKKIVEGQDIKNSSWQEKTAFIFYHP